MNCRTEFGPEYAVPPDVLNYLLANGWRDESWHNDACPRFFHPILAVCLWVDAEDVRQRETSEGQRFALCDTDSEGGMLGGVFFFCEDETDCLSRLIAHFNRYR